MDWVEHFYSVTGSWWAVESSVGERDTHRVDLVHQHASSEAGCLVLTRSE